MYTRIYGLIPYPGGKTRSVDHIVSRIGPLPPNTTFVEPFLGGGVVALTMLARGMVQRVRLNDADCALATLWTAVIREPEALIERVQGFRCEHPRVVDIYERLRAGLYFGLDLAFAELVARWASYRGLGVIAKRPCRALLARQWRPDLICQRIADAHRLLKGRVEGDACTSLDALEVVEEGGEGQPRFLFLDPPYVGLGPDLYRHGMGEGQHRLLAHAIRESGDPWLLCYDDHAAVRQLYRGYQIEAVEVYHHATAQKGCRGQMVKREVRIRSFDSLFMRTEGYSDVKEKSPGGVASSTGASKEVLVNYTHETDTDAPLPTDFFAPEPAAGPCPRPPADPKAGRRYLDTVAAWLPLGYTVIPSVDGKKPAVRWRDFSSGRGRIPRRPRRTEQKRWNRRFGGCPRGCLILDSHKDPARRLVVIDIDVADEALLRWAEQEFGATPLIVTSGRGWHLFYRAPEGMIVPSRSGMIGPDDAFDNGVSPIDIKASGAYVIAAGSWHEKRNREYSASAPITQDLIDSLPVFDLGRYESMVSDTKRRRAEAKRILVSSADPVTRSILGQRSSKCVDQSGTISSDTVVDLAAGGSGSIASIGSGLAEGGYVSVQCPLHVSDIGNASLQLSNGRLRLTCFGDCSASYRVVDPIIAPEPEEAIESFSLVDPTPSVATPDDGWGGARVRRYRAHEMDLGAYLPHDPLSARITLLRAGLGAGKTQLASALALDEEGDVEVIAPRRSLIDDTIRRYGARLLDYRTVKGDLRDSHAVCLDSIHRINRIETGKTVSFHGKPIGLLILDEIRTIRHALTAGCMDGYESLRCQNKLRSLLRGATRIIVADALAERGDLEWVASLAGVPLNQCEVRFVPSQRRWTYKITGDEIGARAAIKVWVQAGERLAIPMMASQACEALGAEIKSWRPGVRVEVVTAATLHDLEARGLSLKTINDWISNVDVLIYSPSLGTGFSIDIKDHFNRIVALAWQNVGTAQDLAQMLHRVRNPKDSTIHIWIRAYGSRPDHRVETIEAEWRVNIDQTVAEGQAHGIDTSGVPINPETKLPYDLTHWKTALAVESDRRLWGARGGLREAFEDLASREGWAVGDWAIEIDPGEAKALRDTKRDARAAVRLAHAEAVVAAPLMAPSDARAIREPENREEALAVERAGICDFYGIEAGALTPTDVIKDDGGKRRSSVAAWGRATLLHEGRIHDLVARDIDEMSKQGVGRVGATGGRARVAWAMVEVLRWFGVDLDAVLADPQLSSIPKEEIIEVVDQGSWGQAVERAQRHRRALAAVGLRVPHDIEAAPARLLGSVLSKLGLGLEAARVTRRVEGAVERSWRYRITGVEEMRRDARAYLARFDGPSEDGEACPMDTRRVLERLADEFLNAA